MGQKGNCFGFVSESSHKVLAGRKLGFKYFDGDNSVLGYISGFVYVRHSADADKLKQLVSAVKLFSDITIHNISAISPREFFLCNLFFPARTGKNFILFMYLNVF